MFESLPSFKSATVDKPPSLDASNDPAFTKLPWYSWWVWKQIRLRPKNALLSWSSSSVNDQDIWLQQFLVIWKTVRDMLIALEPTSIEAITDAIIATDLIPIGDRYNGYHAMQELVFSVIGWQTMLYMPDKVSDDILDLALLDELDGYQGEARLSRHQPLVSGISNSIPNLLLNFGMMLPPANYSVPRGEEDEQSFLRAKTIGPKDLNMDLLAGLCGIKVQWVESVSCHLEFDRNSGTLFLFKYPSFCVHTLEVSEKAEDSRSSIHGCALEKPGPVPWATEQDVDQLLREILLSYRLLFGQHRPSRSRFWKLKAFAQTQREEHDRVLTAICSSRKYSCPIDLVERQEYNLAEDFPHLRNKLALLHAYASQKQPRSFRQLWRDKRDSPAWLALWSVLIFGSVGILLAFVQTVFAILQYLEERGSSG